MTLLAGRGIADVTGEAADCGMMGYGKADQRSAGIHLRLRARAFVFDDGASRLLLVVAELPLIFDSVRQAVLRRLAAAYGTTYTDVNTMITCTHTHCGPGGYSHHALYNATTNGFHPATFGVIVDGIVEAVDLAHRDVAPATLSLAVGELRDASTNRSPSSFDLNPAEDRAAFPDRIDPQTTVLTIRRGTDVVGAVNWFATHGTSMTNRNRLISSDNKGYAAYRWERLDRGVDYLADEPPGFVGAFAQTNAGDMSPNLDRRPGSGPTADEFENTRIVGDRQASAASVLLGTGEVMEGPLDARLTYVDLSDQLVAAEFCAAAGEGRAHRTSGPYGGAAATAGTDEGPGFAGFRQGRNPLLDTISAQLYRASPALRDSQWPKGILVPRALNRVVPLIQERIPVQLWRLGPLYLVGLPAELTIVSGLRLRRAVAGVVGAPLEHVLVAGYSNGYIHYVTTPEEYVGQRYEAGSTMYGRWQLPALVQAASGLAVAMRDGRAADPGCAPPPDLSARAGPGRALRPDAAAGGEFGAVLVAPRARYRAGDTVRAEFVGAYPNNDLRRGGTYLEVQRFGDGGGAGADGAGRGRGGGSGGTGGGSGTGGEWARVADDGDWSTRFAWRRAGRSRSARRGSRVTISWQIPPDAAPGRYRLVYRGDVRGADGRTVPLDAATEPFEVR